VVDVAGYYLFHIAMKPALLLAYGAATLVHFVHNAEFLGDYPNMPTSWARADVYVAWLGMTAVGLLGWWAWRRGHASAGIVLFMIYAALGLDSLGHYVVAPMSAHTLMMNATILLEVTAAALVFFGAARLLARRR
jgi:hypothetical protein